MGSVKCKGSITAISEEIEFGFRRTVTRRVLKTNVKFLKDTTPFRSASANGMARSRLPLECSRKSDEHSLDHQRPESWFANRRQQSNLNCKQKRNETYETKKHDRPKQNVIATP